MYHLYNGDARAAVEDRRRAVMLAPEFPETHSYLAAALSCDGDGRGALRELNKAVELGDRNASTFLERGRTRASFGDHGGAIADLTQAIEIDPKCDGALAERAAEYLRNGDLDAALSDCDAALHHSQPANTTRASILIARKRFKEALDDSTGAILLHQDEKRAHQLRGLAFAALGAHAPAVEDFNQAIALAEQGASDADTRRWSGRIPITFARVFEPNGLEMSRAELSDVYTARARSFEAMGRTGEAARDRERANEIAPSSPER